MSSNINTALADCEKQAQQLIDEIGKFRAAGVLSEHTAASLNALCVSLRETQSNIQPFTEVFSRRVLFSVGVAFVINCGLLTAILVILLSR